MGICGAATGVAITVLLIGRVGFTAVLEAAVALGLGGMAVMTLARLLPLGACATAWWIIAPGGRPAVALFLWFRYLRDAAGELLGITPCAGEVVAVRAMMLAGQAPVAATASVVADFTIELSAQIVFTLLGAVLLLHLLPDAGAAAWAVGTAAALVALVTAFAWLQRLGLAEVLRRLGLRTVPASLASATVGFDRELTAVYGNRARVMIAHVTHLVGWALGGLETWIGCRLLGAPVGLDAALALECAVFAMRSVAFLVPSGIGVQEGGYLVVGALLGLPPETALALSLVKRGRDLLLGMPALLAWQGLEARRQLWAPDQSGPGDRGIIV
jgi:putative membrane protein